LWASFPISGYLNEGVDPGPPAFPADGQTRLSVNLVKGAPDQNVQPGFKQIEGLSNDAPDERINQGVDRFE
jgi:hypothetical protein